MKPFMLVAALLACALAVADVSWEFDDPDSEMSTNNLAGFTVSGGHGLGRSSWDPYVYLPLPKGGLDVSDLPYLTVRLYSSQPADVLDVYYKCSDGRWGLGATEPIRPGWVVYRVDMREALWHESLNTADAKQWGGILRRIVTLRIDPGNEADRWILVDSVALTTEPTGPLGAFPEPMGKASDLSVLVPESRIAGQPVPVEFSCKVQQPVPVQTGTALVRLMSGTTPIVVAPVPVDLTQGTVSLSHEFRTSAYSFGGEFRAEASILELEGEPAPPVSVTVTNPRVGNTRPAQTQVAPYRGEPSLYLNGTPIPAITYLHHGGKPGKLHAQMAEAGVKLYSDWFGASVAGGVGWFEDGTYDFSAFDAYFTTVLDAVPDAYFLPHIGIVAPGWWQKKFPEECCLYSNGTRGPSSMASELWKKDMTEYLKRLLAHLRTTPYADRILGYIFYAGYTAEWQNWATWQQFGDDYSEPALAAFRRWLERKYETNDALAQAWNDPDMTLAKAGAPSFEARTEEGPFLLDPATDMQVIDFSQFMSDMVADAIIYFGGVSKEACNREQIAGTYYGYMAAHNARQPRCGHNGLAQVLDCPDIDFLMSPPMYTHRQLGGTSTFMTATESVKLHGKLWLDESDLRSYLSDEGAGYGRTSTPDASVATTWREFANVLTRRVGVCWFDMSGGWFSGKPMLDCYARQMQIAPVAFERREPFHADVAVFTDEKAYASYRESVLSLHMISFAVSDMPQAGITWDFYLLSDMQHEALPSYKLYAVLNPARLDDAAHAALMARAKRDNATVLYFFAPGCASGDEFDPDSIERLTGMAVQLRDEPGTTSFRLEPGTEFGKGFGDEALLGPELPFTPRPAITDPSAEVIARYADDGAVAVARKVMDGVPVIYCAPVAMPVGLWRNIARSAGAHVYCETDDALYTDGQYLALHASADGDKTIKLPGEYRVTDLITGERIAERTDTIERSMKMGETLFVELARPE